LFDFDVVVFEMWVCVVILWFNYLNNLMVVMVLFVFYECVVVFVCEYGFVFVFDEVYLEIYFGELLVLVL